MRWFKKGPPRNFRDGPFLYPYIPLQKTFVGTVENVQFSRYIVFMAGRISVDLARRQGANLDCEDCDEFVSVGEVTNPVATQRLMEYWTHGKGALKIRWGTDGSFARCVRHLRKYFPKNPNGLCANLHHRATGEWPREHGKAGIPS